MAGNFYVVPPQRTGLQDFVDAANPYLQMAFKQMLERKYQEQQQPYEIQKALISGGYAQPVNQQLTPMGLDAQQALQQNPQAQIPKKILEMQKKKKTPDFTAGNIPFKYSPNLEQQYKQTQIDLNKTITDRFKNLGQNDLVYRDATTGQEVDAASALADISQGNTNKYIISRAVPTKYGINETPISKPEDLTQEEKTYVIASKRIQGRLKDIQEFAIPKIKDKSWGAWQSYQAQGVHPLGVMDKDVQRFQSDLQALKADIPFLRGGKQLTPMEARRVDMLVDPLGKSEERYAKDIQAFIDEFVSGEQLMLKGVKSLNQKTQPKDEFSSMSDEELRKIASGG